MDKEEIIHRLKQIASHAVHVIGEEPYAMSLDDGIAASEAVLFLENGQEQKHGHWKGFTQSRYFGMDDDGEPIFRDGLFYVCSECRRKSIIKHPYCPRCGARMDEEVKQE